MTHGPMVVGLLLVVGGCVQQQPAASHVQPGIEVLIADSAHLIRDRRVGLLTNQTGIDRDGIDDLTRLLGAGAQVTAIFTPEHGYRGMVDTVEVGDGVDAGTGIPIFSLYGQTREPTPEMLGRVDVIVADLQDIGTRTYTYISTILLAMRAASLAGLPVVVLDRPDPIGGVQVEGPVLDTAFASFVGMLPVPQRHGMTMGELAKFGNAALDIGANLTVVPASGWTRAQWFDGTGLPWVRPSPNMPDLESATHYPGTVLFEPTNLSVGRGTEMAFQVIGAPWLDVPQLIHAVGPVPGVELRETVITPQDPPDGKFGGRTIAALRLVVVDRRAYEPVRTAVTILAALARIHSDSLRVNEASMARLAGTDRLWREVQAGEDAASIVGDWERDLERFRRQREPYLIYPSE